MRIVVIGAGGVGGCFGGELARAGHDVTMFARGAHLAALRERGITVRGPDGEFTARVDATDDIDGLPTADLAVVAVKSYSLADVIPVARALAGRGANVIPFLNGVTAADELIAGGVPRDRVLGGIARISAARTGPGVVERRSTFKSIVVGELGGGLSDRAIAIADTFRGANIDARVADSIGVEALAEIRLHHGHGRRVWTRALAHWARARRPGRTSPHRARGERGRCRGPEPRCSAA